MGAYLLESGALGSTGRRGGSDVGGRGPTPLGEVGYSGRGKRRHGDDAESRPKPYRAQPPGRSQRSTSPRGSRRVARRPPRRGDAASGEPAIRTSYIGLYLVRERIQAFSATLES